MKRIILSTALILATLATLSAQDISGKWFIGQTPYVQGAGRGNCYLVFGDNNYSQTIIEGETPHQSGIYIKYNLNFSGTYKRQGKGLMVAWNNDDANFDIELCFDEEMDQLERQHPGVKAHVKSEFNKQLAGQREQLKRMILASAGEYTTSTFHQIMYCKNGIIRDMNITSKGPSYFEWKRVGEAPKKAAASKSKTGSKSSTKPAKSGSGKAAGSKKSSTGSKKRTRI